VDSLAGGPVAGYALLLHLSVALAAGGRAGLFRLAATVVLGRCGPAVVSAAGRSVLSPGRGPQPALVITALALACPWLAVAGAAGSGTGGAGGTSRRFSRAPAGSAGASGEPAAQQESAPGRVPQGG